SHPGSRQWPAPSWQLPHRELPLPLPADAEACSWPPEIGTAIHADFATRCRAILALCGCAHSRELLDPIRISGAIAGDAFDKVPIAVLRREPHTPCGTNRSDSRRGEQKN